MKSLLVCLSVTVTAFLLPACAGESDDDLATAEQASTGVEASADMAYLSDYVIEIGETEALELPPCVTVDTDHATYADVTFAECLLEGLLYVDGAIHAAISLEAGPTVVYAMSTADLAIGGSTLSGSWTVRDPAAAGAPSTWTGQTDITGPNGRAVAFASSAEWSFDGECASYSIEAQMERAVGTANLVVDGVTRCLDQCPAAGSVEITNALGAILSWAYDGDATATVVGPRGRAFEVTLLCGY
jgi:hypothetical protein